MAPNLCKSPIKPWFLGVFDIRAWGIISGIYGTWDKNNNHGYIYGDKWPALMG